MDVEWKYTVVWNVVWKKINMFLLWKVLICCMNYILV